jgi:hypothetical protein
LLDAGGVDGAFEFDDTDGEAGDVEITRRVDVGHLGGFAAQERAPGDLAAAGDAFDHLRCLLGDDFAQAEVIEKDKRLSALNDEVVDVHGDAINADGVVDAHLGGKLDLGTGAVCASD